MNNEMSSGWEIAIVIALLAIALPEILFTMSILNSDSFGGFDTSFIEKSALVAQNEVIPNEVRLSKGSIVLMVAIAEDGDETFNKYDISGVTFTVDQSFRASKLTKLNEVYAALSTLPNNDFDIKLRYGQDTINKVNRNGTTLSNGAICWEVLN